MKNYHELRREEILKLAHQARLMILDGDLCYLNDIATDKELIAFARMLQNRFNEHKQPV